MKTMKLTRYALFAACMAFLLPLFSCVDDNIDLRNDNPLVDEPGNAIKFKVNLRSLSEGEESSAPARKKEVDEEYEDYIDQKSLRVLFFYADENIKNEETGEDLYNTLFAQFGPDDFTLIPISDSYSNNKDEWYVRIPVEKFDGDFAKNVRENNFKIAVLANWPSGFSISNGNHISKLHRQAVHSSYTEQKYDSDGNLTRDKSQVYSKILDEEKKLGLTTGWVNDGEWKDEATAEKFIRENCYPGGPEWEEYGHLWTYWNFAPIIEAIEPKEDDQNHYKWYRQNYTDLREWISKPVNGKLKQFKPENPVTGNFEYIGENATLDTRYENNKLLPQEGIVLPQVNKDDWNKKEYIHITLPASGTLKIKWGSADGKNAKIRVERRNHIEDGSEKDSKNPSGTTLRVAPDKDLINWDTDITGDAEHISIFSQEGNVIIYDIEYICPQYLGYIDRKGKNPKDQYIPMYGVQVFDKLGDLWVEGTTFDLSNFNLMGPYPFYDGNMSQEGEGGNLVVPYEYREISLIRSVAKVVLKIPIKEKPHHVFLRCMNRKAFCEPLDVSTPTNLLWEDDEEMGVHNKHCEFFNIIGQTPFYKGDNLDTPFDKQLSNYQNKIAWYYSAWDDVEEVDEDFDEMTSNVNHEKAAAYYKNGFPSDFKEGVPHIFNPMIERSDFCEFLYAGQVDGMYEKYVLYVPEKFVDDPNDVGEMKKGADGNAVPKYGMEESNPKVCHIEFRTLSTDFKNLEDDNCYRIYFTEGGFNKYYKGGTEDNPDLPPTFGKVGGAYDTWENNYEKKPENLKKHWPILRNHVYSFTVLDADAAMLVIQLEIVPWNEISMDGNSYNW